MRVFSESRFTKKVFSWHFPRTDLLRQESSQMVPGHWACSRARQPAFVRLDLGVTQTMREVKYMCWPRSLMCVFNICFGEFNGILEPMDMTKGGAVRGSECAVQPDNWANFRPHGLVCCHLVFARSLFPESTRPSLCTLSSLVLVPHLYLSATPVTAVCEEPALDTV